MTAAPGAGVGVPAPPRLISVTPAAIDAWQECPRRYRHAYVDRPAPRRAGGPWAHLAVGNVAHAALAAWWDLPLPERVPTAAAQLVAAHWPAGDGPAVGFRDDAHADRWREQIVNWLLAYLTRLDPAAAPVGVERTVATREQGMALSGRADRIDVRPDRAGRPRLAIVDYKTGKRVPADHDAAATPALAVYALAAGRMWSTRCDRAELHHLPTGTVATVIYDRARLMRQISRLADLAREANARRDLAREFPDSAGDLFPPQPGRRCASCPFRHACPDGQAAAPPADPWAYLPED